MNGLFKLVITALTLLFFCSCAKPGHVFQAGKARSEKFSAKKNAELAQAELVRIEEINSELKTTLMQIETVERSAKRNAALCK
jgi:hypothetical protein